MSIKATCDVIRCHLAKGHGRAAKRALQSMRISRRLCDSRDNLRHVLRVLGRYQSEFPDDAEIIKRALWRAVRALTPAYVPSPAFDCIHVETVDTDLKATRNILDAYASGRLSVMHRLYHYGYREAVDALDAIRKAEPYDANRAPSAFPRVATKVLHCFGTPQATTKPTLSVLRAAMVLSVVASEPLHSRRALRLVLLQRPDLVTTIDRVRQVEA